MPEMTEAMEATIHDVVPREEYNQLIKVNLGLTKMPREFRRDLPRLPGEFEGSDEESEQLSPIFVSPVSEKAERKEQALIEDEAKDIKVRPL